MWWNMLTYDKKDLIKSSILGFGKLPDYEFQQCKYMAEQYRLDKIGLLILIFLRIYEDGPRGNEFNLAHTFARNSSFKVQCEFTAKFIADRYKGIQSLYNFFFSWVQYNKRANPAYNKDNIVLYQEFKKLKSRVLD